MRQILVSLKGLKPSFKESTPPLAKPIVILGAWGSGTSALTGVFERLRFYCCPPYFRTSDPRTPNSYESQSLRRIILPFLDEAKLERLDIDNSLIIDELKNWRSTMEQNALNAGMRGIVMKVPQLCFFVPELQAAFDPHFIVISRPLDNIESSRKRRKWASEFGSRGAKECMRQALSYLIALQKSFLCISYKDLVSDPARELKEIEATYHFGLNSDELTNACKFIVKK